MIIPGTVKNKIVRADSFEVYTGETVYEIVVRVSEADFNLIAAINTKVKLEVV